MENKIALLSKEKVISMTTLSYPTIWRMMKKGDFPKSVSASNRRVAWLAKDIEKWIEERSSTYNSTSITVTQTN